MLELFLSEKFQKQGLPIFLHPNKMKQMGATDLRNCEEKKWVQTAIRAFPTRMLFFCSVTQIVNKNNVEKV
jgi:hypothetical protein